MPLTPKEDEIRRSGGIFAVGRREFRASVATPPGHRVAGRRDVARRLTTTEQIVWAHRVDKDAAVVPGATLRVYADLLPASRRHGAVCHPHLQPDHAAATRSIRARPPSPTIISSSPAAQIDERQTSIGREFARTHGMEKPYYATPGDGIFHFYFPEQGLVHAGPVHPRRRLAQPRVRRVRRGRHRRGLDHARVRLGDGLHLPHGGEGQRRVIFHGALQPWVTGKDIVLELLRRWGARQSQGMSVEFVDRDRQLPITYRNTIANMMAEAEALNGIFAPDEITRAWYRAKGIAELPYPFVQPGADAAYEIDEALALGEVVPMIAKPFSPGNAYPGRRGRARAHRPSTRR